MRLKQSISNLLDLIHPLDHLDIAWAYHKGLAKRYESYNVFYLLIYNYILSWTHVIN